jgi:hypothetical protein
MRAISIFIAIKRVDFSVAMGMAQAVKPSILGCIAHGASRLPEALSLGRWSACGWGAERVAGRDDDASLPQLAGYRLAAEVISHTVWLYFCFPLSLRRVEEMLAAFAFALHQSRPRVSSRPETCRGASASWLLLPKVTCRCIDPLSQNRGDAPIHHPERGYFGVSLAWWTRTSSLQ